MEALKIILIAIVLMTFVVVALATQILLKKGGKFPNSHIGGNKHMKERGISCVQTYDKIEQAKARKELRFKNISPDNIEPTSFC
jgi:hypothetical protein